MSEVRILSPRQDSTARNYWSYVTYDTSRCEADARCGGAPAEQISEGLRERHVDALLWGPRTPPGGLTHGEGRRRDPEPPRLRARIACGGRDRGSGGDVH